MAHGPPLDLDPSGTGAQQTAPVPPGCERWWWNHGWTGYSQTYVGTINGGVGTPVLNPLDERSFPTDFCPVTDPRATILENQLAGHPKLKLRMSGYIAQPGDYIQVGPSLRVSHDSWFSPADLGSSWKSGFSQVAMSYHTTIAGRDTAIGFLETGIIYHPPPVITPFCVISPDRFKQITGQNSPPVGVFFYIIGDSCNDQFPILVFTNDPQGTQERPGQRYPDGTWVPNKLRPPDGNGESPADPPDTFDVSARIILTNKQVTIESWDDTSCLTFSGDGCVLFDVENNGDKLEFRLHESPNLCANGNIYSGEVTAGPCSTWNADWYNWTDWEPTLSLTTFAYASPSIGNIDGLAVVNPRHYTEISKTSPNMGARLRVQIKPLQAPPLPDAPPIPFPFPNPIPEPRPSPPKPAPPRPGPTPAPGGSITKTVLSALGAAAAICAATGVCPPGTPGPMPRADGSGTPPTNPGQTAVASCPPNDGKRYWRGAKPGEPATFTPRSIDFKVDSAGFVLGADEPVKIGRGLSLFDNPTSVASNGFVPHEIDLNTIPCELTIEQRGNDPKHYEIFPKHSGSLTTGDYLDLLSQIRVL